MTTYADALPFAFDSTANLRIAGANLNSCFSTVGLIQTGDSGQINWATVTHPGAINTSIGYEIWKFSDSSYYFKLEWFTSSGGTGFNVPTFYLTVGTGSNGSGTITGILFPRTALISNSPAVNTSGIPRPSFYCHNGDYLGVVYKTNGAAANNVVILAFAIEKMVDTSGAVSGQGIVVSWMTTSGTALQNKRSIGLRDSGAYTGFCVVPANLTASIINTTDVQFFHHQIPDKLVILSKYLITVIDNEVAPASEFTAKVVGPTNHQYLCIGNWMGTGNSASAAATWSTAMFWE